MGMLYEFNDLKNLLSMRGVESELDIEQRFSDIAEILLNKTAIRKGERLYFLTDIEFYWFSKNHKDTITYPRNCNAGEYIAETDARQSSSGTVFWQAASNGVFLAEPWISSPDIRGLNSP